MSEPKEKVDISALKDAFLECPVCVEHFNQIDRRPRLLHSCLHAFCTQCLQQLFQKENKAQVTCPLCRQVQAVTGDIMSLPLDPVREQLLEYLQIVHKQEVLCKDCPDNNTAKSRCTECGENLCPECEKAHKRHRSSRSHRVVPLEDFEKESCGSLKTKHFCTTHPDRAVECFCDNCEFLCCLLCAVVDHKGHDFKQLDDAARVRIKEIEDSLPNLEKVSERLTAAKSDCDEYVNSVEREEEELLLEVNKKFDLAENLLGERRQHLLKEITEYSECLISTAKKNAGVYQDALTEIQSVKTYFTNAKSKTDDASLLQTYPSLKKNINSLVRSHSGNIEKCVEKISFEAAKEANVHRYINEFGNVKKHASPEKPAIPAVASSTCDISASVVLASQCQLQSDKPEITASAVEVKSPPSWQGFEMMALFSPYQVTSVPGKSKGTPYSANNTPAQCPGEERWGPGKSEGTPYSANNTPAQCPGEERWVPGSPRGHHILQTTHLPSVQEKSAGVPGSQSHQLATASQSSLLGDYYIPVLSETTLPKRDPS